MLVVHSHSCPHCVDFLRALDASLERRLLAEVPALARIERVEQSTDIKRMRELTSAGLLPTYRTVPAVMLFRPGVDKKARLFRGDQRTFENLRAAIEGVAAAAAAKPTR